MCQNASRIPVRLTSSTGTLRSNARFTYSNWSHLSRAYRKEDADNLVLRDSISVANLQTAKIPVHPISHVEDRMSYMGQAKICFRLTQFPLWSILGNSVPHTSFATSSGLSRVVLSVIVREIGMILSVVVSRGRVVVTIIRAFRVALPGVIPPVIVLGIRIVLPIIGAPFVVRP